MSEDLNRSWDAFNFHQNWLRSDVLKQKKKKSLKTAKFQYPAPRNYIMPNEGSCKTWIPSPPLPYGLPPHDHIPFLPPQDSHLTQCRGRCCAGHELLHSLCMVGYWRAHVRGRTQQFHPCSAQPLVEKAPRAWERGSLPSFPTLQRQTEHGIHWDYFFLT